jgi:hypothetical protein
MKTPAIIVLLAASLMFWSCESEQAKKDRMQRQEQQRIIDETRLENARKEKELYNQYINNSLPNGSTPYEYCYGNNNSCPGNACSQINVRTPTTSDVVVLIKSNDIVVRHAYIKAGYSHTFYLPNGTYQPFFYYGKGWNPEKFMKTTFCGELNGGFIDNEQFSKDDPQFLSDNILEYELILQQNGNFSTMPSNQNDAL